MPIEAQRSHNGTSSTSSTTTLSQSVGSKRARLKLYRSRSNTDSEMTPVKINGAATLVETSHCVKDIQRNRLYDLFHLIEKEFDSIYTENIALRAKVEALTDRLGDADVSIGCAQVESILDAVGSGEKHSASSSKKAASQMSQKLKTAFRVPPGRLVSSFRGVGGDALRARPVKVFSGHRDGVWDVSVAPVLGPGSRTIIGTASADHTARLWCVETGTCFAQYAGHTGSVNSIRFLPSCQPNSAELTAVTGSGDRTAHLWRCPVPTLTGAKSTHPGVGPPKNASEDEQDPGSEKDEVNDENLMSIKAPSLELTGHTGVVIACDWLCDHGRVITASWDRTANIYDVDTGQILNVLSGHDQELTHVSAHTSQKLVVTSSKDSTFRLWDFRDTIHSVAVFQGHSESVTSAVFSASDKVISGGDDRTVKVWDLKNMRSPLATIRLDSPVNRLSVSTRHSIIAIPHDNRQVRLYDLNGNRIARLPRSSRRGHGRMVCSCAWADDNVSMNLFTCGFDRSVIGWKFG